MIDYVNIQTLKDANYYYQFMDLALNIYDEDGKLIDFTGVTPPQFRVEVYSSSYNNGEIVDIPSEFSGVTNWYIENNVLYLSYVSLYEIYKMRGQLNVRVTYSLQQSALDGRAVYVPYIIVFTTNKYLINE